MITGLLIIIVFPFIYFYAQMNNFNQKTDVIRTAINEGKEIYIDPVTNKMHWTETGEQVVWTEILSIEKNIPNGCVIGDKVLRGIKTGYIYRNQSIEEFNQHVQRQINNNKCWHYGRTAYNKKEINDNDLRYHIKNNYYYYLGWSWDMKSYYICFYDNNAKKIKKITFAEYKKLGGCDNCDKTRR